MEDRHGIFAGDDPFVIAKDWLAAASEVEPNDPNAMALATVDETGMPNTRVVLLKDIDTESFVFYTNYGSAKSQEALGAGKAAFVLHWKSLRRQIRCRGTVVKEDGPQADAYFASRSTLSRQGAYASRQSEPLAARQVLMDRVAQVRTEYGDCEQRPSFWGGIRIVPLEIEFWADGESRLHDRFKWSRSSVESRWDIERLNP
ncbi:MAG: pyridoxamine 5'-phosphate oxidase [Planktomarina sp.]